MRLELPFRWRSLKAKLISNYLVILGIGGLVTSIVGSYIVSTTIMAQARRSVDHDLAAARAAYDHQLETLKLTIRYLAAGAAGPEQFDFVSRTRASNLPILKAALAGNAVAGTEVDPEFGMILVAAAPVRGPKGEIAEALYGVVRLNRESTILDSVDGVAAIYYGLACLTSTLKTPDGRRVYGAGVPDEVRDTVIRRGESWRGRTQVAGDWYISAFEPIRSFNGRVVGMLYVGTLESTYTATRDRVILSFFGLATIGFFLIIGLTYYEIRAITQPIAHMVAATRNIAAGRFDQEVASSGQGEVTLLADSFNTMLKSLRQMKGDLEEWGRTLEQKVKLRTEELVAVEARAAQSERLASIGMLAAGVAHEINNPLGAILALTALTLEETKPGDPNRENLEEVLKQTQRCRDIVKGLLEFSRQSVIHTERVNLNRILEDTLALIGKQSSFFNVQVVKNWEASLPEVQGDKSQLQQVFMNILVNAVQAMDERGTITITTRRGRLGDAEVVITDTGRGIPEEVIARIFDPFFTTKTSGEGTGLGLSIAYGIVTKHHGAIHVESAPNQGATFTVRLPAAT